MDGTLASLSRRADRIAPLAFLDSCLRGVGQVTFMNNPLTGLLVLVALFLADGWLGTLCVVALLVATGTATAARLPRAQVRAGLYGFNGLLTGAAGAVFLAPSWSWPVLGYVVLAAATSVPVTAALGALFVGRLGFPALTIPFNLVALTLFAMAPRVARGHAGASLAPSGPPGPVSDTLRPAAGAPPVGGVEGVLHATFRGIAQLFLADSLLAGVVILVAIALCSRLAAALALAGALVGVLTALVLGADGAATYHGLYTYNAYISAVAVGYYFRPTARAVLLALGAAVWATIVTVGIEQVFAPWALPALTVPFCLVTVAALLLRDAAVPGLRPVPLDRLSTPEQHRRPTEEPRGGP